jgi:hypothetical protein
VSAATGHETIDDQLDANMNKLVGMPVKRLAGSKFFPKKQNLTKAVPKVQLQNLV